MYIFKLSTGVILGVETGARLKIDQLFRIGEFARSQRQYTLAVPWLELTIRKLLDDEEYDNTQMANFARGILQAAMMEVTLGFKQTRMVHVTVYSEKNG